MAGGVDEVQLVVGAVSRGEVHTDRLRFDRDPLLALQLHGVEHLVAHVARVNGARDLQHAIGERRFAVVDVGDDREVADACLFHVPILSGVAGRRAEAPREQDEAPPVRAGLRWILGSRGLDAVAGDPVTGLGLAPLRHTLAALVHRDRAARVEHAARRGAEG